MKKHFFKEDIPLANRHENMLKVSYATKMIYNISNL